MDKSFQFKIVTPERVVYEDRVERVSLPTAMGEITVLQNHEPLVGLLEAGELTVGRDGVLDSMAVQGGLIYVAHNTVVVLADSAVKAADIDEQAAEEARKKAEATMRERHVDSEEYAEASAAFLRELTKLRVARKHRTKRTLQKE